MSRGAASKADPLLSGDLASLGDLSFFLDVGEEGGEDAVERPGKPRGTMEIFYPKYIKDILTKVCIKVFYL